jgi:hypothetical protein
MDFKFIFLLFFEELLHATNVGAQNAQGLKGRMLRKKFFLPLESWFFTFLLLMLLHDAIFNVTATI